MASTDPISILKDIEIRCLHQAAGVHQDIEFRDEWTGIAFRTGGHDLVTPIGDVVEILTFPKLSRVPKTLSWLRGIANIRGNLLPVIDLNEYLNRTMTQIQHKSRVLVVDYKGVYAGLVVDDVIGLKHFSEDELLQEQLEVDAALQPYITHAYVRGDRYWNVFSMYSLAESARFLQAAV